jgi:hypothetical protein
LFRPKEGKEDNAQNKTGAFKRTAGAFKRTECRRTHHPVNSKFHIFAQNLHEHSVLNESIP